MNQLNRSKRAELTEALSRLARVELAVLPTPLEHCARLTNEIAGPTIWMKRDDLTGLTLGGNKTRMFEYVLGKAISDGVNTAVAGAAAQSNYCRQLAASCAKLGLACHLVLRKVRGEKDQVVQGSLLLDLMVGAEVTLVDDEGSWAEHGKRVREKAADLESAGRKVLVAACRR